MHLAHTFISQPFDELSRKSMLPNHSVDCYFRSCIPDNIIKHIYDAQSEDEGKQRGCTYKEIGLFLCAATSIVSRMSYGRTQIKARTRNRDLCGHEWAQHFKFFVLVRVFFCIYLCLYCELVCFRF